MKRSFPPLVVACATLWVACTQSQTGAPPAELQGTYGVALVGDLVFVTSSDRNELRALELAVSSQQRGFVRAPNPLRPLSIPVLERPEALARDVRYDDNGLEVTGPYVYARSSGSKLISIVGAEKTVLKELARVSVPGIVTAFAARGPSTEGAPSLLFFATQSSAGGQLWRLEVPPPSTLAVTPFEAQPTPVLTVPASESITALLVMPQSGQLVVATRGQAGLTGGTSLVDEATGSLIRPLAFGGPVRFLATHGKASDTLPAGARVFGVLDEAACGAEAACLGVLSVDASTGEISKDGSGAPMLPLVLSSGLPTGLSLGTNVELLYKKTVEDGTVTVSRALTAYPLVGILPLTNGRTLLFNGEDLRLFDLDAEAASLSSLTLVDSRGVTKDVDTSSVITDVTHGVTRSALYQLTYQGVLPGLSSLPRDTQVVDRFEIPAEWKDSVLPNDSIVLVPSDRGPACSMDLAVATVVPPSAEGEPAVLTTTTPVPVECANFSLFDVRAAGERSFVVVKESVGYVGRLGVGQTNAYEANNTYFFHPDGYDAARDGTMGLEVRLTVRNLQVGLARGDRYTVSVSSHFAPYSFAPDTSTLSFNRYRVPGGVVHARIGTDESSIHYAYIAYPSANGILQANLEGALDALSGLTPFE